MRLLCRNSTRLRSNNPLAFERCFPGNGGAIRAQISAAIRHAPQHITDTDMWGVSDPAERPRGRGCEARAGSLTPHLYSDSCAGALSGRHKTPPGEYERSDANSL